MKSRPSLDWPHDSIGDIMNPLETFHKDLDHILVRVSIYVMIYFAIQVLWYFLHG